MCPRAPKKLKQGPQYFLTAFRKLTFQTEPELKWVGEYDFHRAVNDIGMVIRKSLTT